MTFTFDSGGRGDTVNRSKKLVTHSYKFKSKREKFFVRLYFSMSLDTNICSVTG